MTTGQPAKAPEPKTDATGRSVGTSALLGGGPHIDVVFDGPPSHEAGRFVEVEDARGCSIKVGEWVEREDGLWALRVPDHRALYAEIERLRRAMPVCELCDHSAMGTEIPGAWLVGPHGWTCPVCNGETALPEDMAPNANSVTKRQHNDQFWGGVISLNLP